MVRLKFSITIKSTKENVWQILWSDNTYNVWASVFTVYSNVVTDWSEDSKILFLSLSGCGMHGIIEKKEPNQLMSIKHVGIIDRGEEQPLTTETQKWSGGMENYYLSEKNGATLLEVELDILEEHQYFYEEVFPASLDKIRTISERNFLRNPELQMV